jgi:hypothetical protein
MDQEPSTALSTQESRQKSEPIKSNAFASTEDHVQKENETRQLQIPISEGQNETENNIESTGIQSNTLSDGMERASQDSKVDDLVSGDNEKPSSVYNKSNTNESNPDMNHTSQEVDENGIDQDKITRQTRHEEIGEDSPMVNYKKEFEKKNSFRDYPSSSFQLRYYVLIQSFLRISITQAFQYSIH